MNILLVKPQKNYPEAFDETPSLALLTLGTLAENEGHVVKVLHMSTDQIKIREAMTAYHPDILGITCNTFQVKSAKFIADYGRKWSKDLRIVVGGPHAVAYDGEADDIVIGEGENRWLEILGAKTRIETIDDIPPLDYSLIDLRKFPGINPVGAVPSMAMMASRGCPYSCSFCNTPVFWGKKIKFKDPRLVVEEVNELRGRFGIQEIFFQDDTFNLNYGWAEAVFNYIIEWELNQQMIFKIACRVNEKLFTQKFLDLAKEAGVWNIFFGIESGSQMMLDRMHKGITLDEVRRAIQMTDKAHISSQCSFILGMPGETHETIKETREFLEDLNPTRAGFCYACPFPQTALDKEVTKKGHKFDMPYEKYGYGMVLCRTDALSYQDLENYKDLLR